MGEHFQVNFHQSQKLDRNMDQ